MTSGNKANKTTAQIGDIRPQIAALNASAKNGLTCLRFPNGF